MHRWQPLAVTRPGAGGALPHTALPWRHPSQSSRRAARCRRLHQGASAGCSGPAAAAAAADHLSISLRMNLLRGGERGSLSRAAYAASQRREPSNGATLISVAAREGRNSGRNVCTMPWQAGRGARGAVACWPSPCVHRLKLNRSASAGAICSRPMCMSSTLYCTTPAAEPAGARSAGDGLLRRRPRAPGQGSIRECQRVMAGRSPRAHLAFLSMKATHSLAFRTAQPNCNKGAHAAATISVTSSWLHSACC